MNKIIIIDTSILCCWLNVHNKETCGSDEDKWDHDRVDSFLKEETSKGAIRVLPLPVIIETGNHIAQAKERRFECANRLVEIVNKTLDEETPWAAFSDQTELWESNFIKELLKEWPELVKPDIKGNLSWAI